MRPLGHQQLVLLHLYILFTTVVAASHRNSTGHHKPIKLLWNPDHELLLESQTSVQKPPDQSRESVKNIITLGLVLSPRRDDGYARSVRANTTIEPVDHLETLIRKQLNEINNKTGKNDYQLELITSELVSNPIEMSKIVCQQLLGNPMGGISAVIVDTDPQYVDSIASISFTLSLYNIPVIGTILRDPSLFNKNLHSSYISLIPPHSHQADVWYRLMQELGFKKAIVLISAENQDLLSRFIDLIDDPQIGDERGRLEIEAIIEYDFVAFGDDSNSAWLYLVGRMSSLLEDSICRVFLIHAQTKEDVRLFMKLLHHLNLTTTQDTALFLTEETAQLANEIDLPIPVGTIWSRLGNLSDLAEARKIFTMDALELVLRGVEETSKYQNIEQRKVSNSCQQKPSEIDRYTGMEMYWALRRQQFAGLTGYISFDDYGNRLSSNYELLNSVKNTTNDTANKLVGEFWNGYGKDSELSMGNLNLESKIVVNVSSITWPGGISGHLISGFRINRHLSIVTIEEKPFIWVLDEQECWPNKKSTRARLDTTAAKIPCKRISGSNPIGDNFCCIGYCMDLLREISQQLNFTYDLYLAPDNQYGNLRPESVDIGVSLMVESKATNRIIRRKSEALDESIEWEGQQRLVATKPNYEGDNEEEEPLSSGVVSLRASQGQALKWSGLMGELVARRADMAFAPLTITLKRAQAIDFSKPFKFHGFSILLRRASKHTTLASFLQPFHNSLWILVIGVATHVVALTLYLLDRYSTLGQFGIKRGFIPKPPEPHKGDGNDNGNRPLHLSSSLWFSWSILLNSGVGEHTPKSLSGRVLGIFWSGFAMIVVASYTANLAAFLVLDSREETPTLSGIDDPRLRSGDLAFNFATIKNSAVDAYLQSQVEYINLYRKMEEFDFGNVDESIKALRAGAIDALIWDSTRLEWEVATDENCSLGIAGELFGSGGYGIGLQRNSHWTKNVTTKLLELHESGFMIELDKKWISAGRSSREEPEVAGNNQGGADNCVRHNEDKPETLGISNIAGVFILFAGGLVTSMGLIVVERVCYKHRHRNRHKIAIEQGDS